MPLAVAVALIVIVLVTELMATIVVPDWIPVPLIISPTTKPVKLETLVILAELLVVVPENVPPTTRVVPTLPVGLYPV